MKDNQLSLADHLEARSHPNMATMFNPLTLVLVFFLRALTVGVESFQPTDKEIEMN